MFTKTVFGLDISDHTIEVVELKIGWQKIKVINKYSAGLEKGLIVNGRINDSEKLFDFLNLNPPPFFHNTDVNRRRQPLKFLR